MNASGVDSPITSSNAITATATQNHTIILPRFDTNPSAASINGNNPT